MDEFVIRAPEGSRKKKRRVGRGPASGKGSTAGRGTKGQKSRSGGGVRLGFEGGQMPLYRRVARRGFSNYPFKKEYQIVNVESLSKFEDNEIVNAKSLKEKGLIKKESGYVKILGNGKLEKKLIVEGVKVSGSAREKIEKAGGQVKVTGEREEVVPSPKKEEITAKVTKRAEEKAPSVKTQKKEKSEKSPVEKKVKKTEAKKEKAEKENEDGGTPEEGSKKKVTKKKTAEETASDKSDKKEKGKTEEKVE